MSLTDADLAELCAASYKPAYQWDNAWSAQDIHVAHKLIEGIDVIVFRGSVDYIDWVRDFKGIPEKHPRLGWCHDGFLDYMDLVFEEVMAVIGRDIIVTGHSLGAARASILAGLLVSHGSKLVARVVFGEPRPGFNQLATILRQSGAQLRSYRNGSDPVTQVPELFGRYVHPSPLIALHAEPQRHDDMDVLRYHDIDLYLSALRKETPSER